MSNEIKLTPAFLEYLEECLEQNRLPEVLQNIEDLHAADIAEIIDRLDVEHGRRLLSVLPKTRSADVIVELDDEVRQLLFEEYSASEIALDIIGELDSDDAADIIAELPEERIQEVLDNISDEHQAREIAELLTHEEDTAGALMAKELVKVNKDWKVMRCVREMRKQAEEIEQVHTVYVVDDDNELLGTLSLKKLLTTSTKTPVSEVYHPSVVSVNTDTDAEEVARIMRKYDLVVIPVVNEKNQLMGRITIDDVLDVMAEEAGRDYQMASGLTQDVEARDNVIILTKARLPWVLIGMIGGVLSSRVIDFFDITLFPEMALFIPLIAATGGNVGVQSAALVVQSLASEGGFKDTLGKKLLKDLGVGLLTGVICASVIFLVSYAMGYGYNLAITVSIALISVIVFAALFGTFIPLMLNKINVDPAVAVGPFITTTNDIIGLFIYFGIGRIIMM
ncbi:MAG: magnesium transporter [Cryomorphaceae bacterium]|nr:magnesium transporter [Cryomorphaceae bacterium]